MVGYGFYSWFTTTYRNCKKVILIKTNIRKSRVEDLWNTKYWDDLGVLKRSMAIQMQGVSYLVCVRLLKSLCMASITNPSYFSC